MPVGAHICHTLRVNLTLKGRVGELIGRSNPSASIILISLISVRFKALELLAPYCRAGNQRKTNVLGMGRLTRE